MPGVFSSVPPSFCMPMSLAVPAHGLGSLSNDEGGASGAVHRLAGERDWMLRAGFVRSDRCGGIRTVRWTRTQALEQTKLGSAQRDAKLLCFFFFFNFLVSAEVAVFICTVIITQKSPLSEFKGNRSLSSVTDFFAIFDHVEIFAFSHSIS